MDLGLVGRAAVVAIELRVSTPEQKCIGLPEQKCISDARKKSPRSGGLFVGRQTSVGLSAGVSELARRERRLLWLSL